MRPAVRPRVPGREGPQAGWEREGPGQTAGVLRHHPRVERDREVGRQLVRAGGKTNRIIAMAC